mgnify:CR=1 FL=1
MEDLKYENELWGKVDFLHERYKKKHLYVSNFIDIITKFQNACLNFSKSLLLITNKNYQLLEDKNSTIYKSIESLISLISLESEEYNELFNNIKSNILEPTMKILEELNHKEKELYISFTKCRTQYNNSKPIVEKAQKEYENSIKITEKVIHSAKEIETNPLTSNEDKEKNLTRANTFIISSKNVEDKYFMSIEEANKMRTNEFNKEKEILNFYQNIDINNYNQIKGLLGIFLVFIKKANKSIFTSIESLSANYQNINIAKDINSFIQNNKSENKPDNPIAFKPYNPEATLSNSSISGDPKENEILHINYEVISTLRKSFRNICEDLNMEEETRKHRLRILSLKIFKIGPNVNFSKEEKKELISYLKVPKFRNYFIITLSKQRTKGRFQRGEKLIEDLAEILNFILDISEREQNYEDAKNCIILSQTFYTEIIIDKKTKQKYKRYLFDYIMDNKWLTSISFWAGIIDFMIQKEIKKNEEISKDSIEKESLEDRRLRISNIGFTQLLSYANNMIEFYVKKETIKQMLDLFIKKYDIEKNMADMIYETVENTPERPKPILPLKKQKKNSRIVKSKSFKLKDNLNLKINFEMLEKKSKKINSIEKYRTKLILVDTSNKLKRKNKISKDFKRYNDDESEDLSFSMTISNKSSIKDDKREMLLNRNQSCQSINYDNNMRIGALNFDNKKSFDQTDKMDKNITIHLMKDNSNSNNNSIKIEEEEKSENEIKKDIKSNEIKIIEDSTNNNSSNKINNDENKVEINDVINQNININEIYQENQNVINIKEEKEETNNNNIESIININEENRINEDNSDIDYK